MTDERKAMAGTWPAQTFGSAAAAVAVGSRPGHCQRARKESEINRCLNRGIPPVVNRRVWAEKDWTGGNG